MRLEKLMGTAAFIVERALDDPGEIEVSGHFIACAGFVDAHTDEHFPRWSAFLTLRNDRCRVWQRGGYRGIPKAGERFALNIHKKHGVNAGDRQALVLIYADAKTKYLAERNLELILRRYPCLRQFTPEGK